MKHRNHSIKHLALVLVLGTGLATIRAEAQAILEVGGSGTIGDETLPTMRVPAAGVNWTAAGGEGFKASNLISPPVTVTTSGPVTLKFSHRYFIEKEWDGGAVFISVNGGPPNYLPETAFTANGYVGDTLANGTAAAWPGGEKVFYDKSPGYDTSAMIESVASLGTLNAGDTVSVHFRGRWDGGYFEPTTNWEMAAVRISDPGGPLLNVDFMADGASGFTVASDAGLAGPWVYLKPVSRFEIDADALTADRYKPTTPGSVINLNGANMSVALLGGTLAPGETFTLFDLSGGTTLSGAPGSISLPPGTWDTSKLGVNGTIVCVLPVIPPPPMPVTDGMKVWLSADTVNPSDADQVRLAGADIFVKQWNDRSPNGRNATNGTANDQPRYIASGLNGKPVLRFAQDNEDNGDRLYLGDLSAEFPSAGSVFVVTTIDNDGRYNLFGNRNNNDERWVANTWNESRPGSFRQARSTSANFTMAEWPTTGSHIVALESSSSVYNLLINGTSIGTDTPGYNAGGGANWTIGNRATAGQQLRGDIAELILFNRVLTPQEANKVGGYLAQKYRLTTAYPLANLAVTLDNPVDALAYPTGTPIQASVSVDEVGTAPFTVEFWVDGALAGTDSTAPYSLNLGILGEGSHSIYAKVVDSSTPAAVSAFSAAHLFTVAPATATTTTLTTSANPATYGSGTLTATVVANNATPLTGGTVQFFDGGAPLGSPVAVNTATGQASFSINTLGVGSYQMTATYSGFGVHAASSAPAVSQVVEKAALTVTANHIFRAAGMPNLDPLPYKITGFQNGQTLATSGISGEPLLTTPAVLSSPAGAYTITCAVGGLTADNYSFTLVDGTLTIAAVPDTFSVNFFVGPEWPYGGLGEVGNEAAKEALKVAPGMPAGFADWFTSGWTNYLVPWAPATARPPLTLTSNRGSTARFTLIDCRNGWTYSGTARTTLVGDGNGNMMDGHVNSTLDPDNGVSNSFKMEMSDIPFPVYDVIFYIGANQAQFGDGKGAIVFNGGQPRDFTIKPGAFDGTFTEMVDADTPGNYIVFKGVTGSTFTAQTYGKGPTGFNHVGPFGFQIRPAGSDYETWALNYPDADLRDSDADYDGDGWTNDKERLFGLNPTGGAPNNPFTSLFDPKTGTLSFTRRNNTLTGKFADIETSTDLQTWTVDRGAALVDNGPDANGVEIVNVTLSPGLLAAPKLFVRVNQRDASVPLSENFETGNGGFTVVTTTGSAWVWGDPDSNGAGGSVTQGNGGSLNCWGTNIGNPGYYIIPTETRLRSAEVDLTRVSAAVLTFAEALDLDAGDSAVVNIIESATDAVISPAIYTATDSNVSLATWEVANGGNPIPIPAAAIGKKVRIEWRLSGQAVDFAGWYIDDIMVKQVAP